MNEEAWSRDFFKPLYNVQSILATAVTTLLVLLLTTRFVTGGQASSNGSRTPTLAPYWVPFLGHVPRVLINVHALLIRLRNRYSEGIFSIRLLGSVHTIIFRPSLVQDLFKQPKSVADDQWAARHLMLSNFGLRKRDLEAYDKIAPELQVLNQQHLSGSNLDELTKATSCELKKNMADLITFNSFPVDMMEWERLADADLIEDNGKGEEVMQVNLMELIRNFVAKTANTTIFGLNFCENFPDFWQLLWIFDEGFESLALDIPFWVPSRASQRGRSTMKKLLGYLYEFHDAMEKEILGENQDPKWEDIADASQLVKSRVAAFRKHGLSLDARAACDLALVWSLNANSTSLIYWNLFELYQDPVLLDQVRDELAPFVKVVQPKNDFGMAVWVPPRIETLDIDGLIDKCPTLNATCAESTRLYGGGWTARHVQEDIKLSGEGEPFLLKKGTFVHVVEDLWFSDPQCFPNPQEWQVGRHIEETVDKKGKTQLKFSAGHVKPYGKSHRLIL